MDNKPVNIFISYAHKDEKFKEELIEHLAPLQRQELIETWNDREITPGEVWDEQIKAAIENAEIILLLISPSFMASNYINDIEIRKALDRNRRGEAKLVPIIIRPTDFYDFEISKFQALPTDALPISKWTDRDEAWLDVITKLKSLIYSVKKGNIKFKSARRKKKSKSSREALKTLDISDIVEENIPKIEEKLELTKKLISEGKTKNAIELLLEHTKEIDSTTYNELILHLSRLNSVEREMRIGVISREDRNLSMNRINMAVLSITSAF